MSRLTLPLCDPGVVRTPNLSLRRRLHYPIMLRDRTGGKSWDYTGTGGVLRLTSLLLKYSTSLVNFKSHFNQSNNLEGLFGSDLHKSLSARYSRLIQCTHTLRPLRLVSGSVCRVQQDSINLGLNWDWDFVPGVFSFRSLDSSFKDNFLEKRSAM